MKLKKNFVLILLLAAILTFNYTFNVNASTVSIKSLQSQIKSLQAQIKSLKAQNSNLQNQIKNSYLAQPLNITYAFDGTQKQGAYTENKITVPSALMYKGIIYAPVNFIAQNLGKPASYVSSKKILYIGNKPDGNYLVDVLKPYYIHNCDEYTNYSDAIKMGGKPYYKGYELSDYGELLFNLEGKYKSISGIVGVRDMFWGDYAETIEIYGDDNLITKIDVYPGELPKTFSISVENVLKLRIKLSTNHNFAGLANIIIK